MTMFGFGKKKKTLEELEEEAEYTDAEINLLDKKRIKMEIEARLGKGGMSTPGIGGSFQKAAQWLKSH